MPVPKIIVACSAWLLQAARRTASKYIALNPCFFHALGCSTTTGVVGCHGWHARRLTTSLRQLTHTLTRSLSSSRLPLRIRVTIARPVAAETAQRQHADFQSCDIVLAYGRTAHDIPQSELRAAFIRTVSAFLRFQILQRSSNTDTIGRSNLAKATAADSI